MSIRILDGSGDWVFGASNSNYANGNSEVAIDVETRIMSFYRDCFFDLEAGIDYFNLLDYNNQQKLENAIQDTIIKTNGVIGLNKINLYINSQRNMTLEYNITTIYSDNIENEIELTNLNVV